MAHFSMCHISGVWKILVWRPGARGLGPRFFMCVQFAKSTLLMGLCRILGAKKSSTGGVCAECLSHECCDISGKLFVWKGVCQNM